MEQKGDTSKIFYQIMNLIMSGYTILTLYRWTKKAWEAATQCSSWGVTEFLINYQGGYVRRGLMGEILYQIAQISPSIDPRYYIVSICLISFCVLAWFLIFHFKESNLCWWLLPLNVCLSGAFDFIRKDFICTSLIILILTLYTKIRSRWLRILACSACLILALNIHECIFFMIAPFLIFLYLREPGYHLVHRLIGLSIPIVFMCIVCMYKGDNHIAQSIWNSWCFMYDDFSTMAPQTSIEAIGWESNNTFIFHAYNNFLARYTIIYGWFSKPLVWSLIVLIMPNILFIKRNWQVNKSAPEITRMLGIMIFQFLSLLPMFTVLSCDGSRICFYWTVTSLLIYFCLPHSLYLRIAPQMLINTASFLQKIIFFKKSCIISIVLMLFICISPVGTSRQAFKQSVLGTYAQTCFRCLKYTNIIPKDTKLPI